MSEQLARPRWQSSKFFGWVAARWAVIILVGIGFVFPTSAALIHNKETSPLDEWVFIDYTSKVFNEGFVRRGENVGQYTADLMACYGVIPGGKFGACGTGEEIYSKLPYGGRNGAADYAPSYFWVTAIIGGGIHALTGIDQLTAWRMTGAFWLAAAMLVMYLLFRRWKLPDGASVALGLLVIGSPFVLWANTFVSTDAPSIFLGALLLFLATRIRDAEISPWWLVLLAPIALSFKVTNMAVIGFVGIYLVGSWIVQKIRDRKSMPSGTRISLKAGVLAPALALAASAAIELGWLRILAITTIPAPPEDQGISTPLTIWELGVQATNFLGQTMQNSPFSALKFGFIWSPLGWICVTGVLGAVFMANRWSARAEVSTAILIASIVMAPALALLFWVVNHSYFQLSPRYGASLIPAFMLATGFLLRNRISSWAVGIYGVGLIGLSLLASIQMNLVVLHS